MNRKPKVRQKENVRPKPAGWYVPVTKESNWIPPSVSRKKKEYTTEDFGPVMDAETKPEKVGWYVAVSSCWYSELFRLHTLPTRIAWENWWYWDGKSWLDEPNGIEAWRQDRCWFGLKSKP